MLSDLRLVSKLLRDEPASGFYFDELTFDDESKLAFDELPLKLEFLDHSARLEVSDTAHAYLPSHYFTYAIKIRPLALMLSKYLNIKENLLKSLSGTNSDKAVAIDKLASSITPKNSATDKLDKYSQGNFFGVFKDPNSRLQAKNLINLKTEHGIVTGVVRDSGDFFGSATLKVLPVPDSSSNVLGQLIYAFTKSPNTYDFLMRKYSSKLPYLLKSASGDELLYLIFVTLGLEGKLDDLFDILSVPSRNGPLGSIPDVFLFNTTPVSGNSSYFEIPIHFSEKLNQYVFFKNDLLTDPKVLDEISMQISVFWNYAYITQSEQIFYLKPKLPTTVPKLKGGKNIIIYGAPGTGKSYSIGERIKQEGARGKITVFHADTQYSDFVGSLKPHTERDSNSKPIITYQFRPGPFVNALIEAMNFPSEAVYLVIEEINRAPAAAVFGELFQLLDRTNDGDSSYGIEVADPDMLEYIEKNAHVKLTELRIPSNLSIFATMNSSDQAVMPLDTAFKRRWSFEYLGLNFKDAPVQQLELMTSDGLYEISWADFAEKVVNFLLKEFDVAEDRLVGPFFLNPNELTNWKVALNGKLFVYLWDDVLRHKIQDRKQLFAPDISTFGDLFARFENEKSDHSIFGFQADELIRKYGSKAKEQNA
jgi:hypothetical protein